MMKEISMHILDIVENSVRGGSPVVTVAVHEDADNNVFSFSVTDQGRGMTEETLQSLKDPFTTSRTTRKVGLGIPLLAQTCHQCGGTLDIESGVGRGTKVTATMEYNNIDRPPLGDLASTIHTMFIMYPDVDFKYIHIRNHDEYVLDTKEIKKELEVVRLDNPAAIQWLKKELQSAFGPEVL